MLAVSILMLMVGCHKAQTPTQKMFATPEAAAEALFDVIMRDDVEGFLSILGHQYKDALVTPDWDAEREARQRIAEAGMESHDFVFVSDSDAQLIIGAKEWPFPIPIVKEEGTEGPWHFDTEAGIQEIIDRRIGKNELTAIQIEHAYVDAQIEYALEDRNGDGWLEYAQRLSSTPGKKDGLYWEAGPDEEPSPFGPLVQGAEHYLETRSTGDPIRGYYFKILTRQGEHAPGGAYSYLIDGRMQAGFGLVAYPADYGNSGIMTFIVNQTGQVYQKDIGPFTGMDAYDPDDTWTKVEDEDAAEPGE